MLKRTCGVCSMSLKKTLRHARIILLLILLFIYMDYTLHGIRSFCLSFGVKVSIFEIIVQMFSSANVQGCFILFYAFLISDLPGVDLCEQYVLVRSGKWSWILGKMMTVICLAFVWLLIIALYTFIIVRELNFSTKWDSAMITLSKTNAYSEYSIRMIFESKVITNFATGNDSLHRLECQLFDRRKRLGVVDQFRKQSSGRLFCVSGNRFYQHVHRRHSK